MQEVFRGLHEQVAGEKKMKEENKSKSTRTIYYQKRVEVLKDCIMFLIDLLMLPKKDLEKYSLVDFKKLSKLVHGESGETIIFQKAFTKSEKK